LLPPYELTLSMPAAAAAPRQPFDETFGVRLGGLLVGTFQTTASLDVVGTDVGTEVSFEDELGLDGQGESFRADAWFRFGRAHRVDVAWFRFDRTGTRTTAREIHWGGEVFPIGTSLTGELDTQILQLRYTYYLLAGDDHELGVGLGIYGMNVLAGLRANGLGVQQEFEAPVPLPVLTLQGAWEFVPRLQLVGSLQYFFLELEQIGSTDQIEGSVVDFLLGLEYELAPRFGLGAAYNFFNLHGGAIRDPLDLQLDYGYSALFLFMTVRI
jgi:hypothetical protein